MSEQTIYFLFTDTGTYLSRAINYCTKQSLNHVSIAFDASLKEVYSFGRKRPHNPFIGGFVKEDIRSDFLKEANCAIYSLQLPESDHENVLRKIKAMEAQEQIYKYNFLGLIGVLFRVEIEREYALFCSQFVATVLHDVEAFRIQKPPCFVTPGDIRNHTELQFIYQGKLDDYCHYGHCVPDLNRNKRAQPIQARFHGKQTFQKQSFIFMLSQKVKRLVMK